MNFPTLKTERLTLRNILDTDIQFIFEGLSHPDVIKYYGVSYDSLEATQDQVQWYTELLEKKTGIWWALYDSDNNFVGAGGFNDVNAEHKKAEVGFWLLPQFWGKGYMSEAMPCICDYAFNEIGLHRIEGFVDHQNTNCKKAMNKLKFTLEGTMRDCEIKNGKYLSVDIYAKLKGE